MLRMALALWLLPAAAVAQEAAREALSSAALQMGLPSASLDRRPLDTSRPRDLFRAAPTTYAPGFHEPPGLDPRFFCCDGFAGPVFVTAPPWWAIQPQVVYVPVLVREAPRPVLPPAVSAPPAPAPPPMPGTPKTFYVVPRCYAGDKPPDPATLPPGCDIAGLRIIPPA